MAAGALAFVVFWALAKRSGLSDDDRAGTLAGGTCGPVVRVDGVGGRSREELMLSRTSQLASAIVLSASFLGAAYAQTPAATTPAPAKTPTAQQQRMADCNKSAEGKKGDDRKTYMSACLKGEAPAPAKQLTPQQQKMKDCNAKAGEQKLTGDKRKTFMSTCLKG